MINNIENNRKIWGSLAIMSFLASIIGILNRGIYDAVITSEMAPGVLAQDIMILIASIVIMALIYKMKEDDIALQIIILGLVGYLFYAYGIYVIEQLYTTMYFLYMAIFGLSLYSIVYSMLNIDHKNVREVCVSKSVRLASLAFLIITPLVFYPIWIIKLVELIQNADKVEFFYSIYILDICFIMPAFIIMADKVRKRDSLGTALSSSLFILGFTLLFPISEILKPIVFDQSMDIAGMGLFLILSVIYILLAVMNLKGIKE